MGIVQGIAIILRPAPGGVIAPDLGTAVSLGVAFLPAPFIGLIVLTVALELWLFRSRSGLAVRAAGFNPEASRRIGRQVGVFGPSDFWCALSARSSEACSWHRRQASAPTPSVLPTTLPAFAAVFLGGAVMTGGRGSFVGALLGAVFLSLLDNVTPLLNIPNATEQVIYGIILLVAVSGYTVAQRLRTRK